MRDTERVLHSIRLERERQDAKWGEQTHDHGVWLAVLSEEVGEAAQSFLHDRFGGSKGGTLRGELVQVAAVAVAWIEMIDELT